MQEWKDALGARYERLIKVDQNCKLKLLCNKLKKYIHVVRGHSNNSKRVGGSTECHVKLFTFLKVQLEYCVK